MDWKDWDEYIGRIKSRLEQERDDLRRRAHRAKAEAGDELDKMEDTWKAFVSRVSEIDLSDVSEDVRQTAEGLAAELREGYSRLRETIGDRAKEQQAQADDGGGANAQEASAAASGADYTMGYGEEFLRVLERRSAETHAADLLPLLRKGMRVLDFGCGTGSISVGLATAVAPGELHGIDMEESQIEIARGAAEAGGHDNAAFRTADVAALPFEDDWFDVAHCNAVLMHVPDTEAALAEVMRVLKPGGLLSVRELNTPSSFIEPGFGQLESAWDTFSGLLAANGGHPRMGREIAGILRAGGWSEVRANGSFELFRSADDRAFFHRFVSEWFFSGDTVEAATRHGLASAEQLADWKAALERWRDHPGALAGFAWGAAIAKKPE